MTPVKTVLLFLVLGGGLALGIIACEKIIAWRNKRHLAHLTKLLIIYRREYAEASADYYTRASYKDRGCLLPQQIKELDTLKHNYNRVLHMCLDVKKDLGGIYNDAPDGQYSNIS